MIMEKLLFYKKKNDQKLVANPRPGSAINFNLERVL